MEAFSEAVLEAISGAVSGAGIGVSWAIYFSVTLREIFSYLSLIYVNYSIPFSRNATKSVEIPPLKGENCLTLLD
jgi:hypothetical protein